MNVKTWATDRVKREVEHHTHELKEKVASYGVGAGFGAAAVVFALLGICFALATCTAALAIVMPTWAALLVVTGLLLIAAGLAGTVAATKLRR